MEIGILQNVNRNLIDKTPPQSLLNFLAEAMVDPSQIGIVQQWFGYLLIDPFDGGKGYDLRQFLTLAGPPRSGKTVLANVMSALVGEANVWIGSVEELRGQYGLSMLLDKSLLFVTDADNIERHLLVADRLVAISLGHSVTVSVKHEPDRIVRLKTRMVLIASHCVRFDGQSTFTVNLKPIDSQSVNPYLTSNILNELPSVLGWALEGLSKLLAKEDGIGGI